MTAFASIPAAGTIYDCPTPPTGRSWTRNHRESGECRLKRGKRMMTFIKSAALIIFALAALVPVAKADVIYTFVETSATIDGHPTDAGAVGRIIIENGRTTVAAEIDP